MTCWKAAVDEQCPEVQGLIAREQEFEAALVLRDWCAQTMNHSHADLLVPVKTPVEEMYRQFTEYRAGAWCSAAAHFYAETLKVFGFRATVFTYGYPGDMSHTTTLVYCRKAGRGLPDMAIFVVDSYFGYHYTDAKTRRPLTLQELLIRVIERQEETIYIQQNKNLRRAFITPPDPAWRQAWMWPPGQIPEPKKLPHAWVYPGAFVDMVKLLKTGSYADLVSEKCRALGMGRHEFLLNLLLVNPDFGPFVLYDGGWPDLLLREYIITTIGRALARERGMV